MTEVNRENGQMEICDQVPGMKGKILPLRAEFAPMLVPWSIPDTEYDRINPGYGIYRNQHSLGEAVPDLIILHLPRKILKIPILIQGCGSKDRTGKI